VLSEMGEGPMPFGKELQWYRFDWWHEEDYLSELPQNELPQNELPQNDVFYPQLQAVTKITKPPQYEQVLFGGLS
jgi:hypothetical protein